MVAYRNLHRYENCLVFKLYSEISLKRTVNQSFSKILFIKNCQNLQKKLLVIITFVCILCLQISSNKTMLSVLKYSGFADFPMIFSLKNKYFPRSCSRRSLSNVPWLFFLPKSYFFFPEKCTIKQNLYWMTDRKFDS